MTAPVSSVTKASQPWLPRAGNASRNLVNNFLFHFILGVGVACGCVDEEREVEVDNKPNLIVDD